MKNETQISIFDSIEQITIISQGFLKGCDKKTAKGLRSIFHQWEKTLSYLLSEKQAKDQQLAELKEKYCASKDIELKLRVKLTQKKSKESEMIKEIQAIKDHLEEGKEMWAKQIKKIEEVMQDQERSKQRLESLYQSRLTEIDKELDDILHIHKQKLDLPQNLGNILPNLFSQEELQEENQIALGEISSRQVKEVKLLKLSESKSESVRESSSEIEMNLSGLQGTQKQIFQRLLELRKKVHKFRFDDTTCSEGSVSLPLSLKSVSLSSAKAVKKLSKTIVTGLRKVRSVIFCKTAGIVFGLNGSQKYRAGQTDLVKSDKLSISEREKIVYNLIHEEITGKIKTVDKAELVKQEDWGDMSSIQGDTKELEMSQDLQDIFSKPSLSLNNEEKIEPKETENKEQEASSMSILKDFSKDILSSKRKLSEETRKGHSVLDSEEGLRYQRKFSVDQREPDSQIVIPDNLNLYFISGRPKSNPRVSLRPEDCRSKDTSIEDSYASAKSSVKAAESLKKPISMLNKLPVIPKPPKESKKNPVKTFRGRSLQPVQPGKITSSPPAKKSNAELKSTPPAGLKFRMRRFKEAKKEGKSGGSKRVNRIN